MDRTVTACVQRIMTKCEVFWQSTSLFFCGFLLGRIFTLRSPWGERSHFQVSEKNWTTPPPPAPPNTHFVKMIKFFSYLAEKSWTLHKILAGSWPCLHTSLDIKQLLIPKNAECVWWILPHKWEASGRAKCLSSFVPQLVMCLSFYSLQNKILAYFK